jgi:hypothetical protein
MTHEARIRRIGWIAIMAVCAALYLGLHLKVHSVKSDLVRAEREIVRLEEQAMLMETEFLTRSSQLQLAQWNRVDFGYVPPDAGQFINGERQLAMLGTPAGRAPAGPVSGPEIQLASYSPGEEPAEMETAAAPVSRLAGEPVQVAIGTGRATVAETPRLAMVMPRASTRIQLSALAEAAVR